ncbi:MAG: DNA-formamidopyrimidine glycosylase family protein [Planctomycetota bacterium]
MPELPDVTVWVECLRPRVVGEILLAIDLDSAFVLRTVDPPLATLVGRRSVGVGRIGKRIRIGFEGDLHLVIHPMIAGRLRWRLDGESRLRATPLARLRWRSGVLWFTEASKKKRASLHLVHGAAALRDFERGGIEPLEVDRDTFAAAMRRENRTLKRALTDPTIVSGVGNAYSDEILFAAQLSPMTLTSHLADADLGRLFDAMRSTLSTWIARLREAVGDGFPEEVTAFQPRMAVHGRHRQPCRICNAPIQRIRYADNECNYCARCQTGGRLLADRGLSRLLRKDWPKTLEELEEMRGRPPG